MSDGVGLVSGPVCPVVHPERIPGFFHHQTDHRLENPYFPTANVLYRREAFESLGGFHEQVGVYRRGTPVGGEDIDLAWRARRAGWRTAWAGDAVVEHAASGMSALAWLIEPLRVQITPRLICRVPELRRALRWGLFAHPESPWFYLGLIGVVAAIAIGRLRPLVLTLPWVWSVHSMADRDLWPPTRWWRVPAKYALMAERYTLIGLTLAIASIRHRTIVL
jgi:hypothetical protein